jgi:predicted GIY-YIG superfamily endonuclease
MFFVYILFSKKFDKYYVGQTNDFTNRLKRHNDGYDGFTKPYRPWIKAFDTCNASSLQISEANLFVIPKNSVKKA